jgi:uncharacterized protein DUF1905
MADIGPLTWRGQIRYWDPSKTSGLAVVEVPVEHIAALGGLKQQRVRGRLGGESFASSVMPAGGGRLALGVSKAMMTSARVAVGDEADVSVEGVGKD